MAAEEHATAQRHDGFADALLAWFEDAGRKHLPWQRSPTPYRVWVSEIMLQQTQVATVVGYYERFVRRFPDVRSLAAAPIDEVLHLWTGLGYYARARNLHRAAQIIVAEHDGAFPDTIDAVRSLPGIGRSTAGAILALSGSQRHPILDGNVKRVLARYFGVRGFPGETAIERRLWTLAESCTPVERVASYTQAIMDLGATLCVRSRPLCAVCPVNEGCVARTEGTQSSLPSPRPRKVRPQRAAHVVIALREDGAVLLERRPPAGIWGGLWTFPQFEDRGAAMSWIERWRALRGEGQSADIPVATLAPYAHSFTHFDLKLHPLVVRADLCRPQDQCRPQDRCRPQDTVAGIADTDRYCWYDARRPGKIGLAKPAVDLIRILDADLAPAGQPPRVPP